MSLNGKKILVIDDTEAIRTFLRIFLMAKGAQILEADNAANGLSLNQSENPDLIVLDLGLPDRDGMDLLPDLRQETSPPVIILSVRKESDTIDRAYGLGASGYLTKPFAMEDLLDEIEAKI